MKKDEFLKYFDLCQGANTVKIIDGLDKRAISEVRNHCFVSISRIGQEYAKIKDEIAKEYLVYKAKGNTIKDAEVKAEIAINEKYEVSRRELEWLLEALKQGCNACASRLSVLGDEGRGV